LNLDALFAAPHWVAAPVLLPLATAALMLLLGDERRLLQAGLNLASTLGSLALALLLLLRVVQVDAPLSLGVYLPGNWPVPCGIVFVADRLAVLMLLLTTLLGLAALLYALARWHRAGVYFHALFQLQLLGLSGAFLTADLFNLFVFFEVLLAASYGLLLHGGGTMRARAGLHYVAVNLVASLLFLIGIAVLYSAVGTLNMGDLAARIPLIAVSERGLLHAGAAILALAFMTKAALWPLNAWLPGAYTAASAPVAALFAILTKVGVYAILRLWTLLFPVTDDSAAAFGSPVLIWSGCATLLFGAIGMLASLSVGRVAAYGVIASAGTLLAAFGFNQPAVSSGALYYLASSTLGACALFLLVEWLERARKAAIAPVADEGGTLPQFTVSQKPPPEDANLDDDQQVLVGRAIPFALAFLGVSFTLCALIIAGLPPLSGFVGKVLILLALIELAAVSAWVFFALLILSGLAAAIALIRVGMRHFWMTHAYPPPRLRVNETVPVVLLLFACITLVVLAEPVTAYMRATALALHEPASYIDAVFAARPAAPAPDTTGALP
jgi:multicomponent K+:H+ antiporter subunit D